MGDPIQTAGWVDPRLDGRKHRHAPASPQLRCHPSGRMTDRLVNACICVQNVADAAPGDPPSRSPPTARTVDMPAHLTLGTGLLSGRTSPARARRVIAAALDAGARRIDTARAYGDGETEHLLGAALRGRPDVTVVTKAGLGPLSRRTVAAVRWRGVSPVLGVLPARGGGTAGLGDEEADAPAGARFDERSVRASVDLSRRALRRERLDLVLLHELDADQDVARVADVMEALVGEGAIAAWGVGTRRAALRRLTASGAPLGSLAQTTGGPLLPAAPTVAGVPLSVHSVLGPGGGLLAALLAWLPGSGHQAVWERTVGPIEARRTAGTAVLRAAVSDAGTAAVLLSSRDAASVSRTVTAVRGGETPERLALLAPVFAAFRERDV